LDIEIPPGESDDGSAEAIVRLQREGKPIVSQVFFTQRQAGPLALSIFPRGGSAGRKADRMADLL